MAIEILLLLALPASGKSELRRYLETLDPAASLNDLNVGATVQVDDYPYVHMMRRIAEEVIQAGDSPVFFTSNDQPFIERRDWATLMELLNLDYAELPAAPDDLVTGTAARWLFDRIDHARHLAGLPPAIGSLEPMTQKRLLSTLEHEARQVFDEKKAAIPTSLEDKTVVMEFARGGPEGSQLPLPSPYGYQHALQWLSDDILRRAAILYVWVEPEESRQKNLDRAKPGRDGDASILHHGVPEAVMRNDYGTDDLMWLLAEGGGSYVVVDKGDERFAIPTGVFDNRADLTSFLRGEPSTWSQFQLRQLHRELINATAGLRS